MNTTYDTVGGAYEYVAGYIADSSQSYGNPFASTDNTTNNKTNSIKYATVYRMSTSNRDTENYKENINKIFGDGTIETSTSGTGNTSWHSSLSYFGTLNRWQRISVFSTCRLFPLRLRLWPQQQPQRFSRVYCSKVM